MGLFSKHKTKGANYHFWLHVHSLGPFPALWGALQVEWRRGTKRGGTKAVGPTRLPGKTWGQYEWGETLHIPCTLYPVRCLIW